MYSVMVKGKEERTWFRRSRGDAFEYDANGMRECRIVTEQAGKFNS